MQSHWDQLIVYQRTNLITFCHPVPPVAHKFPVAYQFSWGFSNDSLGTRSVRQLPQHKPEILQRYVAYGAK